MATDGTQANNQTGDSNQELAISANGRYVVFESAASTLVPGDTNGTFDVFVRDREADTLERVSVNADGVQANGYSYKPAISADGRFVTFTSWASNLVPGDTNGTFDVFLRDMKAGTTERLSLAADGTQANSGSDWPAITPDGRYITFASYASNLVAGDTNGLLDVFLRDRETGTVQRISVAADGTQANSGENYAPSISADGRYIAFQSSASNLVAGDSNGLLDVFVRDRQASATERVSVGADGSQASGGLSWDATISADGRFVAFESGASNLVTGDTNGQGDIFVRDRQRGTLERISVPDDGSQASGPSYHPAITPDGRYVVFASFAKNLVPDDTNQRDDVFVRDRETGTVQRINVSVDGTQGNDSSYQPAISADGRHVGFRSRASNLVPGDTNGTDDVFVRDLDAVMADVTAPALSIPASVTAEATSPNGAEVSYAATANDDTDTAPTVECSPASGTTFGLGETTVSCTATDEAGNIATGSFHVTVTDRTAPTVAVSGPAEDATVSGQIAFTATAGDSVGVEGVQFRVDGADLGAKDTTAPYSTTWDTKGLVDGAYELTAVATDTSGNPATSDPITVIVANEAAPDDAVTERVSESADGSQADERSGQPSISADGRYVAFASGASNLVPDDTNGSVDVFVRDRVSGTVTRVNVASDGSEALWQDSGEPSISADGRYVAFSSAASDLVSGDVVRSQQVYVHDRQSGTTRRVSVGLDGEQGDADSYEPSISADGGFVVFTSAASNLVSGDTTWERDVFVRDLAAGTTQRVSVPPDGASGDSWSEQPSISNDGQLVAFRSNATNLVAHDTNSVDDVFVRDMASGTTRLISVAADGTEADSSSIQPQVTPDGRYVVFSSVAENLVPGDTNVSEDVFLSDLETGTLEKLSRGSAEGSDSWQPSISADGRYVAFDSSASHLVPQDLNGADDVFVLDRRSGAVERISVAINGGDADSDTYRKSQISGDGRVVAFESSASNLVLGDTNEVEDVFVRRVSLGSAGGPSDDAAPATTASRSADPNGDGWNNAPVNVTLAADDGDGSGVQGITYRVDDREPVTVSDSTVRVEMGAEGVSTLSFFATDKSGNVEEPRTLTVRVDTTAPRVTCEPVPAGWFTEFRIPCAAADEGSGLADPSDSLFVLSTNMAPGTQSSNASTNSHPVTDRAGNAVTAGPISSLLVDRQPPAAPSVPDLIASSDTGLSNTDNETVDTTPTFTGTVEAGATVWLMVDGQLLGTTTTPSYRYTITPAALPLGKHTVTAQARDAAGNIGVQSSPLTINVLAPTTCTATTSSITGTASANILTGTSLGDLLRGLGGADELNGMAGDDCAFGGDGNDRVTGGAGEDHLSGDAGNDVLIAEGGADILSGGDGSDQITPGSGADLVSAGGGADTINAADGTHDQISCGLGADTVIIDPVDTVTSCERRTVRR